MNVARLSSKKWKKLWIDWKINSIGKVQRTDINNSANERDKFTTGGLHDENSIYYQPERRRCENADR